MRMNAKAMSTNNNDSLNFMYQHRDCIQCGNHKWPMIFSLLKNLKKAFQKFCMILQGGWRHNTVSVGDYKNSVLTL